MLGDLWEQRAKQSKERRKALQRQQSEIAKNRDRLLDRIAKSDNDAAAKACERRIDELEREDAEIEEKLSSLDQPTKGFEEMFEHVIDFLSNPCEIWENYGYDWQRAVLKLVFAERLPYSRTEGLRTPRLSFAFSVLASSKAGEQTMAEGTGPPSNLLLWMPLGLQGISERSDM